MRTLPAEYYAQVSTTRTYADRLATLEAVRQAGISVCAGGIIGLGEGQMDRVGLLHQVGLQAGALWLLALRLFLLLGCVGCVLCGCWPAEGRFETTCNLWHPPSSPNRSWPRCRSTPRVSPSTHWWQ